MTAEVRSNNQLPNRTPAAGKIVYTVNTEKQVIRDPAGNVVFQGPLTLKLVAGQTSVDLPASDDPTLSPSGFTFTATEQLEHVSKSAYRQVEFQTVDGQVRYLADYADGDEIALDPSYGASLNGALGLIEQLRDDIPDEVAVALAEDETIRESTLLMVPTVLAGKLGSTWEAAWASNDEATLRAWFETNTGPRVAIDYANPVSPPLGVATIATQGQADALVGKLINGVVQITAAGLDVRDFEVRRPTAAGELVHPIVIAPGASASGSLHHVTIDGQHAKQAHTAVTSTTAPTSNWSGWTVHHVHVKRCSDAFYALNRAQYEYNYVHDPLFWDTAVDGPYDYDVNPHSDGFQCTGGRPNLRRSFLDIAPPGKVIPSDNRNVVSCLIIYPREAAIDGGVIEENYLNGGTNIFRFPGIGDQPYGTYPTGLIVRNNKLGTDFRVSPYFAGLTPAYVPDDAGFAGVTFSGNKYMGSVTAVPVVNNTVNRPALPIPRLADVPTTKSTGWRKLYTWSNAGVVTYSRDGGTTLPANLAPKTGSAGGVYVARRDNRVVMMIVHGTITGSVTLTLPAAFGKGDAPGDYSIVASGTASATVRVGSTSAILAATSGTSFPNSASTASVGALCEWPTSVVFPEPADWPGAAA